MKDTAKRNPLPRVKRLSEMTTEDLRKFLESVKADSLVMFTDPDEQRKYVESARSKLQQELLEEKVVMTDDDQLVVVEKSTRKLKRVDVKKRPKSRESMSADNRPALAEASPTLSKIFDTMRGDKRKTGRERLAEDMRSRRSIEQLEVLAATLESLSREQQTTSKILEEIRKQVTGGAGSPAAGGQRGGGGIGSALLRTIINNPGMAILGGIGIARAVGSLLEDGESRAAGGELSPTSAVIVDDTIPDNPPPSASDATLSNSVVGSSSGSAGTSNELVRLSSSSALGDGVNSIGGEIKDVVRVRDDVNDNATTQMKEPVSSSVTGAVPSQGRDPISRMTAGRGEAKDDDVVLNESLREQQLLAREYESNPALFSNRNLVLRARKVTFSGDTIRFRLPGAATTMSTQMSPVTPVSMPSMSSMSTPTTGAAAAPSAPTEQPAASPMARETATVSSGGGRLLRPTSGRISSPFGMRAMGDHRGIDFAVPVGTPVVAAHAGTIVEVRESPSYGNMIRIRGNDGIDTLYAHLSSFGVQQGQQVAAGQQIALSGNTGRSTGPHLHFEAIRNGVKIDPAPLMGEVAAPAEQQAASAQTPEPSEAQSDAAPAQTPVAAATPGESPTPGPAQMLDTASSGAAVESASVENAVAERTPAAPSTPSVIEMQQPASSNPSTPPPTYDSSDPNDPGRVEPEDAAERYSMLFNMAA